MKRKRSAAEANQLLDRGPASRTPHPCRAFTLLELLLVIVVVGGIVWAVLGTARDISFGTYMGSLAAVVGIALIVTLRSQKTGNDV